MTPSLDRFDRPMRSLRVSVTDRCNLRCTYCMPEADYAWLPKSDLLDFEEITRLCARFVERGVDRLRLTGGEPLLRRELPTLVRQLAEIPGLNDLALTTNGVLLGDHAEALIDAGLKRVTISLDTLRPERAVKLTGRDQLEPIFRSLEKVAATGKLPQKWNTVVLRGQNDDELPEILERAAEFDAEVRFIEYMDVGGATLWRVEDVVSKDEILQRLAEHFGEIEAVPTEASAPARRFRLPSGQRFGVIASTTAPFCATCDRARLTADGTLYTCLYAKHGLDLRTPMRDGTRDEDLEKILDGVWSRRTDRGAEERAELREQRGPQHDASALKDDPRLEMHTRGG